MRCGACIVIRGAGGTEDEVQLVRKLKRPVIPLFWTGGMAKDVWGAEESKLPPDAVEELKRIAAMPSDEPKPQAEAVVALVRSALIDS